jgi:hypothetical protein
MYFGPGQGVARATPYHIGPSAHGESMGIKLVELLLTGWLREGLLLFVPFVGFMAFSFF